MLSELISSFAHAIKSSLFDNIIFSVAKKLLKIGFTFIINYSDEICCFNFKFTTKLLNCQLLSFGSGTFCHFLYTIGRFLSIYRFCIRVCFGFKMHCGRVELFNKIFEFWIAIIVLLESIITDVGASNVA